LGKRDANDLQWRDVYSREGGEYKLTIGYLSGQSRNVTVNVNGKKVQTLSLNSGSFDKVGRRTINIELLPGYNTIRLSNPSTDMPDLDYIDVEPTNTTAVGGVILNKKEDHRQYDLQGRPVSHTDNQRKVVISNGKKVLH
jgi:hypothetical protein